MVLIRSASKRQSNVVVLIRSASKRHIKWVPQHMFSCRNKKYILWILPLIWSYDFHGEQYCLVPTLLAWWWGQCSMQDVSRSGNALLGGLFFFFFFFMQTSFYSYGKAMLILPWLSLFCIASTHQLIHLKEVGNILLWRLIMKYILWSFSPFSWFKKSICQFLAKECAQYWLTA